MNNYPLDQQLLRASAKGKLHHVISLLQQGATLAVNKHGRTPLHIAAHRGYLDIVRTLLQAGCNPDIQDDNGDTALHRATTAGYDNIVQRLLDEACSIDRQNNLGDTALHEASRCGYSSLVKCMIKANANITCTNKNGDVALHMSCANGHSSTTRQLLSVTLSPSIMNKQKDSPLHLAVRYGHCTCTRLLVGALCDVNCQNEFGNTALHLAVMTQNRKITRILLDAKAEPKLILNCDRKSPIDIARDLENGEIVIMLVSGPRPSHHKRLSRSKHRSSCKYRSRSDPRGIVTKENNSSEECQANTSVSRPPRKKLIGRHHSPGPEIHRHMHKSTLRKLQRHHTASPKDLDEYHRKLVINPYVVPQLYSLHRDSNGAIIQTPVITELPTPPQVVRQLHQTIQQTKQDLTRSVNETTAALKKRIEDLENSTEYRLKSLDHITSERISSERTLCLHRIDQRAIYERAQSEQSIKNKLRAWIESRIEHRTPSRKLQSTPNPFIPSNLLTESEVRSLDSGVGETLGTRLIEPIIKQACHGDSPYCSASAYNAKSTSEARCYYDKRVDERLHGEQDFNPKQIRKCIHFVDDAGKSCHEISRTNRDLHPVNPHNSSELPILELPMEHQHETVHIPFINEFRRMSCQSDVQSSPTTARYSVIAPTLQRGIRQPTGFHRNEIEPWYNNDSDMITRYQNTKLSLDDVDC